MNRRKFISGGLTALCSSLLYEKTFAKEKFPLNRLEEIQKGLFYGEFKAPFESITGNSRITILKVNPKFYNFNLFLSSQYGNNSFDAQEWVEEHNLICAMNAGMFRGNLMNCGYAKNGDHINNPRLTKGYNSFLVFAPKDKNLPEIDVINTGEKSLTEMKKSYNSIIQNLRTIQNGKNKWGPSSKKWSEASIGIDYDGNLLLMHSRSPFSVSNFNKSVLSFPLALKNAMHCEGGPEASLSLNNLKYGFNLSGSYETGFNENDNNPIQWPIPNILGVTAK